MYFKLRCIAITQKREKISGKVSRPQITFECACVPPFLPRVVTSCKVRTELDKYILIELGLVALVHSFTA